MNSQSFSAFVLMMAAIGTASCGSTGTLPSAGASSGGTSGGGANPTSGTGSAGSTTSGDNTSTGTSSGAGSQTGIETTGGSGTVGVSSGSSASGSGGGTGTDVGSNSGPSDDDAGNGSGSNSSPDSGGPATPASNRVDILLDDAWKFIKSDVPAASATTFDDSAWSGVTLPHTWNVPDAESATYYQGPGWYRRHYMVPATYAGRKLFIQFDAVNKVADVYVNGTHLGQHRGGNAAFRFDVTSLVKAGADNVIAVKADNTAFTDVPPLSPSSAGPDFTQFGGAYRDAHLLVTDPVHIDVLDYASPGVFITPKMVTAATANLDVRVELVNDDAASHTVTVEADLIDASGAVVKTMSMPETLAPSAGKNTSVTLSTTVASPHLWNGRVAPYLYTVQVLVKDGTLVRDALSQTTGFRFFSLDASKGFSLNGQYLDLHGVNRHQERQGLGWALTNKEHEEDMALITELGATFVRTSHYQQAQHFYDLGDSSGVILWAEVGLVHNTDASTAYAQNATQQLTELIRQSYNHPAIMFWSLSNELVGSPAQALMTSLNSTAHAEDPTRLTVLADNSTGDAKSAIPDAVGYNLYDGWYSGVATDVSSYLDSTHQAESSRPFGLSEFGAGANITTHSATPKEMDYSEEYQSLFHETYWAALKARPFVWAKLVWCMFDFPSSYRAGSHNENGINNKGLVTHDHVTRKDAFYFFKANWSTDPFVYITSRRFEPRTAASTDIKVYSNASSVTLTLNGTSLGAKTSTTHVFTWSAVTLKSGSNAVTAAGTSGTSTVNDSVTWTLQ